MRRDLRMAILAAPVYTLLSGEPVYPRQLLGLEGPRKASDDEPIPVFEPGSKEEDEAIIALFGAVKKEK